MKYDPINLTNNWKNWLKLYESAIDIVFQVFLNKNLMYFTTVIHSETSGNLDMIGWLLFLLCLTPLSTIFELYCGSSVSLVEETEYPDKTTDLPQVTDKLYHIMLYTSS